MYYLKIQNDSENNYKLKNKKNNEIYKIPKKEEFIVKMDEDVIELEILDTLFYDYKSIIKFVLFFIIAFIPYILSSITSTYNPICNSNIKIYLNDTKVIYLINDNEKLMIINEKKESLKLEYDNKTSFRWNLFFSLIVFLIYILIMLIIGSFIKK